MKNITITALALMLAVGAPYNSAFAKGPTCKGQSTAAKNASTGLKKVERQLAGTQRTLEREVSRVQKKNANLDTKAARYEANVDKLGVRASGYCPGNVTTSIASVFMQASSASTAGYVCTASNSFIGNILNTITSRLTCELLCGTMFGSDCNKCNEDVGKRKTCERAIAAGCGEAVKQGQLARATRAQIDPTIVNCTPELVAANDPTKQCKNAIARRAAQRIGLVTIPGSLSKAVVDATDKNNKAQAALVCCQQGLAVGSDGLQCVALPTPTPTPIR